MIGELLTILSAVIWALSSVFYKVGLKSMKPVTVNTIRPLFALLFLLGVLGVSGDFSAIVELSSREVLYIFLATLFGLIIGDLLYLFGLRSIGIARAQPLSNTYPLFTIVLASLFLNEPTTIRVVIGAMLIVCAIFLLSEKSLDFDIRKGIFFALGAAFFWSASMIVMKYAAASISPLVFSTVRMGIFASILLPYTLRYEKREFFKITRDWIIVGLGAILDLGLGILLFLKSLTYIDVSRAAPLNGVAPIFAVVFATLLANEKLTPRIILGVALSFLGVLIVV
jgi:DME family drug/metabolite transporter